jgi:hypothetical protein
MPRAGNRLEHYWGGAGKIQWIVFKGPINRQNFSFAAPFDKVSFA